MINVYRITLREIALPLREPFQTSAGEVKDRRILLVQLDEADGFAGWGECVAQEAPTYSPETVDTAWMMIRDWLAPRLLGVEFRDPKDVAPMLERTIRGHNMAKAALEMAMWELAAQVERKSLSELLGGTREKVATGISLGLQPNPKDLAAKAKTACDEGYQKIKLKITPGMDVQYVRAVFGYLDPETALMVDANSAYTPEDFRHLHKLDEFGLLMIEQPLAPDDLTGHAELQETLMTPICLDESITSLNRTKEMIALKSAKIVNIKPGRVGGFTSAIAIHDHCGENDIHVWCGGMLESGIGRAHNVALASLPGFRFPGDLSPSRRYWKQDIVTPEWTMDEQGYVAVPKDEPGMGVTVDMDRVKALTVRSEIVELET